MRKINLTFALFLGLGLVAWVLFADYGGYTSRNAMIIARSTSVVSTIDGEVMAISAGIGSTVDRGSPLVTVQNDRLDRNRLTELESQQAFLEREIGTAEARGAELDAKIAAFDGKAAAFLAWMVDDLKIQRTKTAHKLEAANALHAMKATEAAQMAELLQTSQINAPLLEQARSEAIIKKNEALALKAEMARIDLRLASVRSVGVLQENGSASYWEEARDRVDLQLLKNHQDIATMTATLVQLDQQIQAERQRIGKASVEQHKAPFDGVINAVLTSRGERVIAGANLVEVLDCANPIAIVSVPEHRFGEFHAGQRAVIKPLDSDEHIEGAVQHISSSALISRDTSIATSPDLQLGGNKVIVALESDGRRPSDRASCDTARRAVVTIETETLVDSVGQRLAALFGDLSWTGLQTWIGSVHAEG